MATKLEHCDCLNDCGDDDRVKSGKVRPCENMVARMERDRIVSQQLATITALRATYDADNIFDLIEKMQAEVKRLQGVVVDCMDTWNDLRNELDAVRAMAATRKAEIESLRVDAEKWNTYSARKAAVIAAGMGRNPMRQMTRQEAFDTLPNDLAFAKGVLAAARSSK